MEGRKYPWGDPFEASKANTTQSGLNNTSAISQHPAGQSPYGAMDMAGNVWEWMASAFDTDTTVLRGGSWFDIREYPRCAFRIRNDPRFAADFMKFRCDRT